MKRALKWIGGTFAVLFLIGLLIGEAPEESAETAVADASATVMEEQAPVEQAEPEPAPPASTLTAAQQNAVRSANSYLAISGFSRQGLIDQLSSDYGDQYSVGDATAAVDNLDVDWNAQAERSAASYLDVSGFSCQGLIEQLSSEHGDKYTVAQATSGATRAGVC